MMLISCYNMHESKERSEYLTIYENEQQTFRVTHESNNFGLGFNHYIAEDFWLVEITILFLHIYLTNND